MPKCPPITLADIEASIDYVQKSTMEKARRLDAVGCLAVAVDMSKAVSLIDQSRNARLAGDLGSSESALDKARALLIDLLLDPGT